MAAIDTGKPFDDFPANIHAVLDASAAKTAIGHALTYATVVDTITTFPAICVEFDSFQYVYEDPIFDLRVWCNIFYVHSMSSSAYREDDIREAMSAIYETLHDDGDCNEYSEGRLFEAEGEIGTLLLGKQGFKEQVAVAGGTMQVMYPKKFKH